MYYPKNQEINTTGNYQQNIKKVLFFRKFCNIFEAVLKPEFLFQLKNLIL